MGTLIPFVTKKRKKKNYQEILSEYLNHLSSAGNKLKSVSKEMKAQFFMNMNEMAINKNDELKYLILMREEFFKYKLKLYYFLKWKCRALYNRDLIDDENPFCAKSGFNYNIFKSMNYAGQGRVFDSMNPNININNSNYNKNGFKALNSNGSIYGSGVGDGNFFANKLGNNKDVNYFGNNNNFNNNGSKKDLLDFDEDPKIMDNQNQNQNNNQKGIFQFYDSKGSLGTNQNDQLNNIFNSIDTLKSKALSNENDSNPYKAAVSHLKILTEK